MAERSFAREVERLRLGAGQEFRGEGILAVTKALLQCGVGYVAGYQGAPISHLMDVLMDAREILDEFGVRFESSASEAAAAAALAASVHYPIRGAVAWKSTAGTNVASDALSNLASGGVTGGALIIVGEDYGEGSSIMQERTHAFALKSQIWLLDPRPNLESIVQAVEDGFALSEASATPVMLQLRIRACHVHGRFQAKDNRRPAFTLADALAAPRRDVGRIVLPPASFEHERDKVARRWPAAVDFIRQRRLNETFGPSRGDAGLILQGGLYNSVIRALQLLGLCDAHGGTEIPLYVLNVTYPLVDDEVAGFCAGKRAVLLIEEGQPDYIEQNLRAILHRQGATTAVCGKDLLPMAGEYAVLVLVDAIRRFLERHAPAQLRTQAADRPQPHQAAADALAEIVPPRPPGFCTGCPERPIFAALSLVEKELGPRHIAGDIGCHLFSILPPFNIGATTMGYGLGPSSVAAFNVPDGRRPIAIMGDGGFWHNGLASGIGNAVFNKSDAVTIIIDNHYSAATGGQDIPSSRAAHPARSTRNSIEDAVRGLGVRWIRRTDNTYGVGRLRRMLKEAVTTAEKGPKVIIAASECMLNRQRREKPQFNSAVRQGLRRTRARFGVDEDVCTGDRACIRLSGCPSLTVKRGSDPLKSDPVAHVDNSCVGCGNCGEVADAAVLCPSFYRADIVHNPSWRDRLGARVAAWVIGFLQQRRRRRRVVFAG
ncbi:indolepyruvate ferredoxin oxidoreductase subunit alpha [Vineibacter terrae]|uniref:indolepyruvate ferredoxin oxidoreductase subunit alpha n=1 Tax=Vineibacter terrae TaxID=2586908 RepID=UPI002E334F96|nr:indolepyruvate ferredoxin oxidoreductase subunit alpha [Vineibacter terrae]HEX2889487.1 indolepyruvate ferredoxin oxidoreductase subunit alpha [Vineibacter terrae]